MRGSNLVIGTTSLVKNIGSSAGTTTYDFRTDVTANKYIPLCYTTRLMGSSSRHTCDTLCREGNAKSFTSYTTSWRNFPGAATPAKFVTSGSWQTNADIGYVQLTYSGMGQNYSVYVQMEYVII